MQKNIFIAVGILLVSLSFIAALEAKQPKLDPKDDDAVMKAALYSCSGLNYIQQSPAFNDPEKNTLKAVEDSHIAYRHYQKYCQ